MSASGREVLTAFLQALGAQDFATLEHLIHPDYVGEYPQSRERFRGFAAFRAQLEQYPGGPPPEAQTGLEDALLLGGEDRWVITPGYTVLPLAGPDRYTAVVRTVYPDGAAWHIVTIVDLRDGLIHRSTTYFAPEFEAPEWRQGLTERY
ncbi:MAG TPA: nuclear transport factor 2 family protein [Candidatus Limnocylindria bacterium]|nr:nuclear transport factor 2 family protein [Candidatus Limnocylindria bacterium]